MKLNQFHPKSQKFWTIVMLGIGLIWLASLMKSTDSLQAFAIIGNLGINLALPLLFPISWYVAQSIAWWKILREVDHAHTISFRSVLNAKLISESINTVAPISFIAGDPYRWLMLKSHTNEHALAASIAIDRAMYTLAALLYLALNALYAVTTLALGDHLELWFIVITLTVCGTMLILVRIHTLEPLTTLTHLLIKLIPPLKRKKDHLLAQCSQIEKHMHTTFDGRPQIAVAIFLIHFSSRCLGIFEILLIAWLLGVPLAFSTCVLLSSLAILINIVFFFIPASLGVMESGFAGVCLIMGLEPALGVAIQLIRRLRTMVWVILGLSLNAARQHNG